MTPPISRRTVLAAGAAALPLGWAAAAPADASAPGWRRSPLPELGDGFLVQGAATHRGAWASGWRLAKPRQILLHWDGREWKRVDVPDDDRGSGLCVAAVRRELWVISYESPMTSHWDGSAWRTVRLPGSFVANKLSASPDGTVLAVAADREEPDLRSAVMRWEGDQWVELRIPMPEKATPERVAVRTSRDIWVTGSAPDPEVTYRPFTIHWDGRRWKEARTTPTTYRYFTDICPVSSRLAWGLRRDFDHATLLRWTGGDWEEFPLPQDFPCYGQSVLDDGRGGVWVGGGESRGNTGYLHFRNGRITILKGSALAEDERAWVCDLVRAPGSRTIWSIGYTGLKDHGPTRPLVERLY
ncbi:hypothetical protein [Actinomadura terrae]|uniref:hypothetical protein n=1 Tax=Actinomadura terrae TaxID=604353 RepID=UPI001FA79A5E|nr:hypothetical protein [Actinomadura terrae]